MATNFPGALDNATTLGGPFIDVAPPADPQRNIAAGPRNNLNETVLAIEARIGILGDLNPTSLDWATLNVGGTPSQGLRFAGAHAEWPGLDSEHGLFIASGRSPTVCYHRSGDPAATFYNLVGGGGASTWDDLYGASSTMAINVPARTLTWTSSIPETGLALDRTTAFASQTQPLMVLRESGAVSGTTPQPLLHLYGGGASIDYAGVVGVSRTCLTIWREPEGHFMQMSTGTEAVPGDARFTLYSTGRFEIGADTPDPLLYVTQNNAAGSLMAFFNTPNNVLFGVDANGAIFCLSSASASAALQLYNGPSADLRLSVGTDGKTSLVGAAAIANPLLTLDQSASGVDPFIECVGVISAADNSTNISTKNGGGALTGPKENGGWSFSRMFKVKLNGVDYWIPAYVWSPPV